MKPVDMWLFAIENHSETGDIIYDPFLGSGTSVIACEKSGRICFGVELDPHYCSVIIKRWETFTKRKAKLQGHGEEIRTEQNSD